MASLTRHPKSPYWSACFTLPDGTRTHRSTKSTDRGEALRIAHQYEDAAKAAQAGRFIESQARKVIADIFSIANRENLPSSTTADYFENWLKRKELEAGPTTHVRYNSVVEQFIEFLGPIAKRDLANLTAKEISGFREHMAKRLAPGTVNLSIKILRVALGQAKKDGLVDINEAERVSLLKRRDRCNRRPFTLPELRRVLEVADAEWRGLILLGLYTGQRLGDLAGLTWSNVDLVRREIRLETEKTGRRQTIPMAKPLVRHIESLPAGDDPKAPLFPRTSATLDRTQRSGTLSNQFHRLLVAAGLATERSHKKQKEGKGRSARRTQNELGFHCLRHTNTSLLKNAGVNEAVAMEFVGHDSSSVSRQYTHIESDSLRRAADLLPDVTEGL